MFEIGMSIIRQRITEERAKFKVRQAKIHLEYCKEADCEKCKDARSVIKYLDRKKGKNG